jgi:Flp pilus assembly pilin Flp
MSNSTSNQPAHLETDVVERQIRRLGAATSERGQTTAEYALVLIAAATIAMLIVAWAGNTGAISDFFDTIIERITSMLP